MTILETTFNHTWIDLLSLKQTNALCEKLNKLSGSGLKSAMQTMNSNETANVTRFYLLELPQCLLTCDLYEPVKLLYATRKQDFDQVIHSIPEY